MKRLLLLPVLFSFFACKAQDVKISQPYTFLKWINVHDSVRASIYFQNVNDTLATRAYARGFAGGSLGAGVGIKVTGTTIAIDTANYRKMDSLYVVTDSTFIIKINGAAYSYKMRGAVFSFNGRTTAIVPMKGDYSAFYPRLDTVYNTPSWIGQINWNTVIGTPATLADYGIHDGVQNKGGANSWQADVLANRPLPGNLGSFYYGIDDSTIYYDNGNEWETVAGGGAIVPDSIIQYKYGLIKTVSGDTIKVQVDTTILKSVFGAGSGGIFQIFTKYGLRITGTDTATVDTALFVRFKDTLAGPIASRTWVLTRGFLTSESDPVANAKTLTITGTTSAGITITNSANPQTLGSSPTWTFKADTTVLATLFALKDSAAALRAAIGSGGTGIAQIFTKGGIIINGTDTVTVDSTKYVRFADTATGKAIATKTFVLGKNYLTTEVDPVATIDTINMVQVPGAGISWTGLAKQTLGASPTWTIKADTSVLATHIALIDTNLAIRTALIDTAAILRALAAAPGATLTLSTGLLGTSYNGSTAVTAKVDTALLATHTALLDTAITLRTNIANAVAAAPFIPLVWPGNVGVTGNSDTLKINSGFTMWNNTGVGQTILGNSNILMNSVTGFTTDIGLIGQDANPAWLLQLSGPTGGTGAYPIQARHDSVQFYPNSTTTKIKADGTALFGSHVTGVTESTADSSNFLASTKFVKQLLVGYVPGTLSTLTLGSGLLGTSYNGLSAVTAKVDSGLFATNTFVLRQGFRTAPAVDTMFNNATSDSLAYTINSRRHAIKWPTVGGTSGLTRVAPLDSLARTANPLQVVNTNTLVAQTADHTHAGFITGASQAELDSMYTGQIFDTTKLGWAGTGQRLLWSSTHADSLYSSTLISPFGLILSKASDSTLNLLADTTSTNHLVTLAYFNAHNSGGPGNTNLTLRHFVMGDSVLSSTGTGVLIDTAGLINPGLLSIYNFSRIGHTLVVPHNGSGGDSIVYSNTVNNSDTLAFKNLLFTGGLKDTTTLGLITARLDTAYTDGRYAKLSLANTWAQGQTFNGANSFTGGSITVPTRTAGDNTTNAASTAFVTGALSTAIGGVHYQTVQANGSGLTQRPTLNFGSEFTAADNAGSTRTDVSINAISVAKINGIAYQDVQANGTTQTPRTNLNFGAEFNVNDDAGNNRSTVTVNSIASTKVSGLAYQQLYGNSTPATQRAGANFSTAFAIGDDGTNTTIGLAGAQVFNTLSLNAIPGGSTSDQILTENSGVVRFVSPSAYGFAPLANPNFTGNYMGLGASFPGSMSTGQQQFLFGANGLLSSPTTGSSPYTSIGYNAYFATGGLLYRNSEGATLMQMGPSGIVFSLFPTGTTGGSMTASNQFTISGSGQFTNTAYGGGSNTGTLAFGLGTTSSGAFIEYPTQATGTSSSPSFSALSLTAIPGGSASSDQLLTENSGTVRFISPNSLVVATKTAHDSSTAVANTQYVDRAVGAFASAKLFAMTADGSVSNTTTPTSLIGTGVGTKTIGANALQVGSVVTFKGAGTINTAATAPGMSFNFKIGTSGTTINPTIAANLNSEYRFEITGIVRTASASGAIALTGWVEINGVKTYFTPNNFSIDATSSLTLDMVLTMSGTVGSGDIVTTKTSTIFIN